MSAFNFWSADEWLLVWLAPNNAFSLRRALLVLAFWPGRAELLLLIDELDEGHWFSKEPHTVDVVVAASARTSNIDDHAFGMGAGICFDLYSSLFESWSLRFSLSFRSCQSIDRVFRDDSSVASSMAESIAFEGRVVLDKMVEHK